jgi:hypothetical protein
MCGKADELRLAVLMGLRKGLSLCRGMRRALTHDGQHKVRRYRRKQLFLKPQLV